MSLEHSINQWENATAELCIPEQGVLLLRGRFDDFLSQLNQLTQGLLSEEVARANQYKFPKLRSHFIICRGILKLLLSQFVALPLQDIEFALGHNGKPYLDHANIHFNVSHSGEWFLIAISFESVIGVDVEQISDRRHLDLADRFFARPEVQALITAPVHQQVSLFFQIWGQKEAFIKADGAGIQYGLDQFVVSSSEKAGLIEVIKPGQDPAEWQLHFCSPEDGYAAAIAYQRDIDKLQCNTLTPELVNHWLSNV